MGKSSGFLNKTKIKFTSLTIFLGLPKSTVCKGMYQINSYLSFVGVDRDFLPNQKKYVVAKFAKYPIEYKATCKKRYEN